MPTTTNHVSTTVYPALKDARDAAERAKCFEHVVDARPVGTRQTGFSVIVTTEIPTVEEVLAGEAGG